MLSDELVKLTEAHHNQLREQGALRDGDTIDDKQLRTVQVPVLSAANATIKLRLRQEEYRAAWAFKDTRRADKWAHRDTVRQMRAERRELVQARKAAKRAAREEKRRAIKAAKIERRRTVKEAAKSEKEGATSLGSMPKNLSNE